MQILEIIRVSLEVWVRAGAHAAFWGPFHAFKSLFNLGPLFKPDSIYLKDW